jgi:hypothetical protein
MSALDKIRQAFPELANASDSEVLGEAARRTGASVAQLSDTLGIAPRSTLGEIGRQFGAGLTVDAPRMAGQALKYFSDAGGERVGEGAFPRLGRPTGLERQYGVQISEAAPGYRAGQALVESADVRGRGTEADLRGRGLVGEALVTGARGVGSIVPTLGLMAVPGGQVLAPALQAGVFGGSSAQDTYEKLIEQGIDPADAEAAARRVFALQGLGEGVATAGLGALLRPAVTAARGARSTSGVAQSLTDTSVLRPFVRGMALNVPLQAGTEAAQDVGTSLIEQSYGAAPEDLGGIARGSALAGAGMTLLLGPLALGGSVTRARRAESLKQALYGEDTPVETRAKAMDLVMGEARRQGVAEQDVDTWFNQQLELEDARTAALRAAEQAESEKQINLLGGKAQELEGLQGGMFSSLDQQRAFEQGLAGVQIDTPFSSLEQQQAFTQGLETARDNNIARIGQQYQDLMGDRASSLMQAQDMGQQAQGILEPQRRGLEAAQRVGEQWQEVRAGKSRVMMDIDDMGQEWQKLAKDLPQPVTGELSRAQKAALRGPEGKRLKRTSSPITPTGGGPMATTLLEPVQNTLPVAATPAPAPAPSSLLSERPVAVEPVEPVEPVTPVGAPTAVAAALPAAQPAAGVSSIPTTGAPSGTQASQTKQAEAQGQKPAAVRIASTQTAEQQAADELGLTQALQVANRTKATGNPLQASVEGAGKVAVPGKASLSVKSLRDIRDALLNPSATVEGIGAKEQRIADAVRAFAKAYYKFSNAGGNMLRGIPTERAIKGEGGETIYKPTKFAGQTPAQQRGQIKAKTGARVENTTKLLEETRAALAALGKTVNGNAKDVEAIVKMVKDMVQQKLHTEVADNGMNEDFGQKAEESEGGKDPTDIAFGKLDTMLSQGWNAAKANMFQGTSDAMFVRQTAIRESKEATAAGKDQTPLEKAAKGYAVFGKGESSDGILGVMNYIQTHGTPFERTIAKAVFESMAYQEAPKLVFITEGNPRFDPKKNTIYIQRDASAAVTLHEALHSALQWYVYKNPDSPEVRALKASLKQVVNFKGPLGADAKRVQDLLKGLVKGKKELDAVLELVSYGNTLNDFRRALEAMDSKEAPKSFFDAANNVWQSILTAVQKMLGVKPSVASDVIANTFKLLEAAGQKGQKKDKAKGNILEAAVQSNAATAQPATTVQAALAQTRNEQAQEAGFSNFTTYKDRPSSSFNITRTLFEQVGFGKDGKVSQALQSAAAKSADIVRKEFPALDFVILNLNSRFGQSPTYKRIADFFKQDAQTGLLEAEYMAQYLYRNPQDAERVIRYMDGDKTVLKDEGRDATLRRMADNLDRHIKEYITTLPAKDQKLFQDMKFSDYALSPNSIAQLAGKSLGIRELSKKLGTERRTETSIDAFKQFLTFKDGVLDTDVPMYQLFETIPDGQGKTVRVPYGFISKDQASANQGLDMDRSRVWFMQRATKADGGPFVFVTRALSPNNLRDISGKLARGEYTPAEREEAVQQVSAALLNTMAALSHNYAATNFFRGLADMERNADGTPTARSIAFDSLEQINATFPDRQITEANILSAPSDEARTYELRAAAQRSGTWVKLPDRDTYGALKGKIIPGTVWNNMLDMNDRSPLLNSQLLSDIMTTFKKSKTVLTPATHVNNILTNYALMLLHNIPHKALQGAAQLMYKYEVSPKSLNKDELRMMQEFYRSGAVLGQFTNTEAKNFITRKLAENIKPENDKSLLQKLAAWANFEKETEQYMARAARGAKLTDNFFTEVYAAGDNVFRLAAFLNTAGNIQAAAGDGKLTDAQIREAGLVARKLFLDYDIDARWVRAARQSFLPFVSWAYAITPVLGRLAVEKPWTIVNMMAALGIMGAMTDGDDDWRDKGPEQVREKFLGIVPSYYRIPFMGTDESPVYYNLGKSIPFISLFQPPMGQSKLFGQEWVPSALTPGGPYTAVIASTLFGIDAFTGKPLADATETQTSKFLKAAESVYNTMTPSVASTRLWGPEEGEIAKLLQNRVGPTGVEPDALFIARTLGFTAYEFNRSEVQFYQDAEVKKIEREFTMTMNKAKRNEYAKGYPDYEALDAKLADLRTRLEERVNKIRGEE